MTLVVLSGFPTFACVGFMYHEVEERWGYGDGPISRRTPSVLPRCPALWVMTTQVLLRVIDDVGEAQETYQVNTFREAGF